MIRSVIALLLLPVACSDARATPMGDGAGDPAPSVTQRSFFEVATQVTAANLAGLLRLDGANVEPGVGTALLLNSNLVVGGVFVGDGGLPRVDGGRIVGTMHGYCVNVGGGLSLAEAGTPGRVGKCEQALNVYGKGQIVVSGLIEQDRFEAGEPQTLAVTGGTGAYQGVSGELRITQLAFPGIVKQLDLTYR